MLLHELPGWLTYDLDDDESPPEIKQPVSMGTAHEHVLTLARRWLENDVQAEALKARAAELHEKAARRERDNERIRTSMLLALTAFGIKKAKDEEFTVSVSTRAPVIQVVDADKLPINFVRLKPEPDKTAINACFKETGMIPEGCELGSEKTFVTIRSK